jgi:hypothetical protein
MKTHLKDKDKTTPPIVIDRYYFKEDETGYLGPLRHQLYVFDAGTRKAELLTLEILMKPGRRGPRMARRLRL